MLLRVRRHAARGSARKTARTKRRLLLPLRKLGRYVAAWADTCADCRAAAALYERLSRLSDAELARRGLSRRALALDAVAALDGRSQETLARTPPGASPHRTRRGFR